MTLQDKDVIYFLKRRKISKDTESQPRTPEFLQTHCGQQVEIVSILNLLEHKVTKGLLMVTYTIYFSYIHAWQSKQFWLQNLKRKYNL
jgi:hypothetical protein